MLSSLDKQKMNSPNFAQTRADIPQLIFSVTAMLARSGLLGIVADDEKYEKFLLHLQALRAETVQALYE